MVVENNPCAYWLVQVIGSDALQQGHLKCLVWAYRWGQNDERDNNGILYIDIDPITDTGKTWTLLSYGARAVWNHYAHNYDKAPHDSFRYDFLRLLCCLTCRRLNALSCNVGSTDSQLHELDKFRETVCLDNFKSIVVGKDFSILRWVYPIYGSAAFIFGEGILCANPNFLNLKNLNSLNFLIIFV